MRHLYISYKIVLFCHIHKYKIPNLTRHDLCGVEILSLGGSAQVNFDRCPVGHNDAVLALRDLGQILHVQDPRATLADVLIAAQEAAQGAEHDSVVLGRNALHFGAI